MKCYIIIMLFSMILVYIDDVILYRGVRAALTYTHNDTYTAYLLLLLLSLLLRRTCSS